MSDYKIRYKMKIGRRAAHDMIMMLAKHGNHYHNVKFSTDADVKRFFAWQGVEFVKLLEDCRDYTCPVPFFENLIGSTWTFSGGGILSSVDMETNEEDLKLHELGKFTQSAYWLLFENSQEALSRAVENSSYATYCQRWHMGLRESRVISTIEPKNRTSNTQKTS